MGRIEIGEDQELNRQRECRGERQCRRDTRDFFGNEQGPPFRNETSRLGLKLQSGSMAARVKPPCDNCQAMSRAKRRSGMPVPVSGTSDRTPEAIGTRNATS